MGLLRHLESGRTRDLLPRNVVGRSPHCDLWLVDRRISGEHAVLWWDDGWWVRDLGSSNGSRVGDHPAPSGTPVPVPRGTRLQFGDEVWTLDDDRPPPPSARAASGELRVGTPEILALPSADNPEVCVFADGQGGWVAEGPLGLQAVRDGESVTADARAWKLSLARPLPSTLKASSPTVDDLRLRYAVSADEEFVEGWLLALDGERELGDRAHHYMVVTLARARLADKADGVDQAQQGWLYQDDLERQLGIQTALLNLHVFRARKQLADLGVADALSLIERRPSTKQLRIGTDQVLIQRA